jgi:hypothetical protein
MRKMNLIIICLALFSTLAAPPSGTVEILAPEPINYYTPLINAVVSVESDSIQTAYNSKEISCSYFQIRPVRLREFNKRTGNHYVMADMYHYEIAKQVFMYYCQGRSYEVIARAWCSGESGTKKASDSYYAKIQKAL